MERGVYSPHQKFLPNVSLSCSREEYISAHKRPRRQPSNPLYHFAAIKKKKVLMSVQLPAVSREPADARIVNSFIFQLLHYFCLFIPSLFPPTETVDRYISLLWRVGRLPLSFLIINHLRIDLSGVMRLLMHRREKPRAGEAIRTFSLMLSLNYQRT